MRWRGRHQSSNIEDRRGQPMRGRPVMMGGGIGMLVLIVVFTLLGGDPIQLLDQIGTQQSTTQYEQQSPGVPQDSEPREFVATILADTEVVWTDLFQASGKTYEAPRLVLYSGMTQIPGGVAQSATGPFYLPTDRTVYLDFSFFEEMHRRFNASGDFAAAYVIAHEVGHHVQHLLGLTTKVHQQRRRISETEYNKLSVRLELQADFLAGVWAHHADKRWQILEEGDIDEAIQAASAIGDDRLQKQSHGRVVPDAFTHGTSKQRVRWFMKGFKSGDLQQGDTFSMPYEAL